VIVERARGARVEQASGRLDAVAPEVANDAIGMKSVVAGIVPMSIAS